MVLLRIPRGERCSLRGSLRNTPPFGRAITPPPTADQSRKSDQKHSASYEEFTFDQDGVMWLSKLVVLPFGRLKMTSLAEACTRGNAHDVEQLLSRIGTPETLAKELAACDDWAGSTPLHWAAFSRDGERCVRLLLERKADPTAKNTRDGSLPIHLAARYGRMESLKVLLLRMDDGWNAVNALHSTPLHESCFQGHADAADLLCQLRANLERSDTHGKTPLLAAVQAGHLEVVRCLLRHGAKTDTFPVVLSHSRSQSTSALLERNDAAAAAAAAPSLFARAARISKARRKKFSHDSPTAGKSRLLYTIPREGALSVAMSEGHVLLVSELLLHRCRSSAGGRAAAADDEARDSVDEDSSHASAHLLGRYIRCLELTTVRKFIYSKWTAAEGLAQEDTLQLFTLLVLSTLSPRSKPREEDHTDPPNPVLYALQLSANCNYKARHYSRDRRTADRLRAAAAAMDKVACGLVEAANFAAEQANAPGQFNCWSTGKTEYYPAMVGMVWLDGAVEFAAQSGLRHFSSNTIVYLHVQSLFLPAAPTDSLSAGGRAAALALSCVLNLATLPFLVVLPRSVELMLQEYQRRATPQLTLFWFTPFGAFFLSEASKLLLALLLTFAPLSYTDFGFFDGVTIAYAATMAENEARELLDDGWKTYFNDEFNAADIVLVALLSSHQFLHILSLALDDPGLQSSAAIPLRSLCCLVAWLRLLEIMFVFPHSGPHLLMALKMFADLKTFLLLMVAFIVPFTGALYVLFLNSLSAADREAFSPLDLFKMLLIFELDATPMAMLRELDYTNREQEWVIFVLAAMFGFSAALLLLNLLIATFAKSVDTISQDLDSHFKLKFAKIVVSARRAPLVPRPLNFVRNAVLLVYHAIDYCCAGKPLKLVFSFVGGCTKDAEDSSGRGRLQFQPVADATQPANKAYHRVAAFIERALSPEVMLLPEKVVESQEGSQASHKQIVAARASDDEFRHDVMRRLGRLELIEQKLDGLAELLQKRTSESGLCT
ncbi:hypothetical protein AB1Y20_002939 [Prymnesium parvum]|uniref:Ion transport domain-containing protein n=1 Tax=Prymnesium parvum TaxID=97485 RepID=A0AB34JAS0_PRYPA